MQTKLNRRGTPAKIKTCNFVIRNAKGQFFTNTKAYPWGATAFEWSTERGAQAKLEKLGEPGAEVVPARQC